ncbi:MAG: hypothetical protein AVDCRST_MAG87-537 [uncultured Thermomicrobiales bacterium]|uniref:Uncharacterized protein n=1 Tax=uncultured Thermomicrobiales bacterium TaxID=1645740 RepID=A0A6J4UD93_9BACT|nr:MAG: hypothetical protein AVDCRST_MAG87-537 [uncultured Thermomicrobiales bacterium]
MDKDKDQQLAELSRRVEQLERGQGFWATTMSSTLATVLGGILLIAGGALWRNPDLFDWVTVSRVLSTGLVVSGVVSLLAGAYTAIQISKHGWSEWDRRTRFAFGAFVVIEIGTVWLVGLFALVGLD